MSNPYGWSPPADGQPAVYFAPPGENTWTPVVGAYQAAPEPPNGNGYAQYPSFMDQYAYEPPRIDPFAHTPRDSDPFLSLSARGAREKVTMTEALILWLRNWNNFTGRASRSEYWWIRVVQLVGQALWWFLFLGVMQAGELSSTDGVVGLAVVAVLLVSGVAALVLTIPTLSLTVRRLHDADHTGWYYLIQFVPFGSWMLFHALRQDSDPAGFRFDDSSNRPHGVEDID